MTEREVMRLMRAVHELDLKEREERYARERAECLPLPRFRAVLLRGDWTAAEQEHIRGCAYCQKTREKVRQSLWHPTLWQMLLHNQGMLSGDEAPAVRHHLEDDACSRCQRLSQSPWLQALGAMVQAGQRTQEQAQAMMMKATVTAFAPLPAPVGAFDPETRPPFQLRTESEDDVLTVTVRETDEGDLVVHVQTPDPEQAGRTVHVEVLGEGEPLTADVVLEAQGERGCAGRHVFGRFAELAQRLGADCAVLAAFTAQVSVSPDTPPTLETTFAKDSIGFRVHLRRQEGASLSVTLTGLFVGSNGGGVRWQTVTY
jgi:hypothetical protein